MKKLIILLSIFVVFSSCTRSVWINTLRPADIDIPQHIQTIAIVNRTVPKNALAGTLESILTGDLTGADQRAVQSIMTNINQGLTTSPRFKSVIHNVSYKGAGAFSRNFPEAFSWAQISDICQQTNADAVLVVEMFNGDWIVTNVNKEVEKKDEAGNVRKVTEYTAKGVATISAGMRLYDPKSKGIIDQELFVQSRTFEGTGNSLADAAAALIQKDMAILQTGGFLGRNYSYKIAPQPVQLQRTIYAKAKKNANLEIGARKGEVGDWKGAIESWENAIKFTKYDKVRKRASYNLGVAYEVMGDFDKALEWTQQSYSQYGFKAARRYSQVIRQRMIDEQRVQDQMAK